MDENSKKIDFFKTSQFFTPTMIDEKTQLGKAVSLLKGLERHLRPERKIDFLLQKLSFITISCIKAKGPDFFEVKNRFFVLRSQVTF